MPRQRCRPGPSRARLCVPGPDLTLQRCCWSADQQQRRDLCQGCSRQRLQLESPRLGVVGHQPHERRPSHVRHRAARLVRCHRARARRLQGVTGSGSPRTSWRRRRRASRGCRRSNGSAAARVTPQCPRSRAPCHPRVSATDLVRHRAPADATAPVRCRPRATSGRAANGARACRSADRHSVPRQACARSVRGAQRRVARSRRKSREPRIRASASRSTGVVRSSGPSSKVSARVSMPACYPPEHRFCAPRRTAAAYGRVGAACRLAD